MGFLLETLRLGLANIRLHKLRSILTILSIIFGVAAVIVMVGIGEGNKQQALAEIQSLGVENILLRSTKPPESAGNSGGERSFVSPYGIERADLALLEETVGGIELVVPMKRVSARVSTGARQSPATVLGTLPSLLEVMPREVSRGRFLTDIDIATGALVAVVGQSVGERLFPLADPLGQLIRVENIPFTVVGVLAGSESGGSSQLGRDVDQDVFVPLSTAEDQYGDMVVQRSSGSMQAEQVELTELIVRAADREAVALLAAQVKRAMNRDVVRDDVEMIVPLELLRQAQQTQRNFNVLLLAIASIGLWISGIGIMNIMLASVTERTREIGIRRAVGATRKHITWQFLVETTVLSGVGGVLGMGLGLGAVLSLSAAHRWFPTFFRDQADPQVVTWAVLASFVAAAVVGVVFGLYPAMQAAKQDPIVALRHE